MFLKPFYRYETGCAAYVLGCGTCAKCAVVDPREEALAEYADFAESKGMRTSSTRTSTPITAPEDARSPS
jgi:hydroxyacylglutathione hydrolase